MPTISKSSIDGSKREVTGNAMKSEINRREFLELAAGGSAVYLSGPGILSFGVNPKKQRLISPDS